MKQTFNFRNRINVFLIFLIFLFVVLGCDGFTSVSGKILDENGKPIKDAKVILEVGDLKADSITKEDGYYDVATTHAPVKVSPKITVIKEGYQTYEQTFESPEELGKKRDIILKKN